MLILIAAMLACGQVLFKFAAQSMREPIGLTWHSILQFALNPYLLVGLVVYGATTILWVLLLRDTALNRAYLVFALGLVLVALAGTFLFREPFTYRLFVGIVIILVGLMVALG
jgi:multidrug transporter EmrE-like cation transporter